MSLLELAAARIAWRSGAIAPPLSLSGSGPRLVLVGEFAPLFALLSAEATLVSGVARVQGEEAASVVRRGLAGLALCDPSLPLAWTAERYLVESGQLGGLDQREARRSAARILQHFEFAARARHQLKDLTLAERRALVLAGATLGAPNVLVAQAPLSRVDAYSQDYLLRVLELAAQGRDLVVSVPALPATGPERGLVDSASQVLWEQRANVPGPQSSRRLVFSVLAHADEVRAALREQGIAFESLPADPLLLALAGEEARDVARLFVELPKGGTARLLELARAAGAPVVELAPV